MAAEIVPGLFRLPGVLGVNVFLWRPQRGAGGDGAPMLFDCGTPWCGTGLVASLVALGVEPGDLATIAVTHDDIDHVGRLAALAAVSGAEVVAHTWEAQRLAGETWRRVPPPASPFSALAGLVEHGLRRWPRQGVRATVLVEDGSRLPGGWLAVHTPGHTPGHTSFFQPDSGILIAGDALGHSVGSKLRRPMAVYCEDLPASLASIHKLAALNPSIICCGHGPPLQNAAARLRSFAESLPSA